MSGAARARYMRWSSPWELAYADSGYTMLGIGASYAVVRRQRRWWLMHWDGWAWVQVPHPVGYRTREAAAQAAAALADSAGA